MRKRHNKTRRTMSVERDALQVAQLANYSLLVVALQNVRGWLTDIGPLTGKREADVVCYIDAAIEIGGNP